MEKIYLNTDGGSRGNPGPAGAGAFIYNEKGEMVRKAHQFLGVMTNNEAEYHAVILGVETLKKVFGKEKIKNLAVTVRLDSELVCRQLCNEYQIKEEKLIPLFIKIHNLQVAEFKQLSFESIPREKNVEADQLANKAMDEGDREQKGLF
ncbi:MAG: ribonuclease HI family protein [Candidatus Vogelbacteria bacterium]|nr:ribonuclease HI family protein [Candidatus Vogelbacteria bacterium]